MKPFVNKSLFVVSLICLGTLLFSSCNKDKNDAETAIIPLIASTTNYDNKGVLISSTSYQYDNQGRVINMNNNSDSYSTLEYSNAGIILKDYIGGKPVDTTTLILNDLGLCTSVSYGATNKHDTNEYDIAGFRKSLIIEDDNYLTTFTYTVFEGNIATLILVDKSKTSNSASLKEIEFLPGSFISAYLENRYASKSKLKSANLSETMKTDFQYFNDKINTIGLENEGTSFVGKQNKNPIKKAIYSSLSGSGFIETRTINFTYEYDTKGRITKQVTDDGNYTVYTYTN